MQNPSLELLNDVLFFFSCRTCWPCPHLLKAVCPLEQLQVSPSDPSTLVTQVYVCGSVRSLSQSRPPRSPLCWRSWTVWPPASCRTSPSHPPYCPGIWVLLYIYTYLLTTVQLKVIQDKLLTISMGCLLRYY
jgi:hypothetical protein